jgi:hypothetical protein
MKLLITRRVEMIGPRETYILSYRIDASFEEMKLLRTHHAIIERMCADAGVKDIVGTIGNQAFEERSSNLIELEEAVREVKRSYDILKGFVALHMQYHLGKVDTYE